MVSLEERKDKRRREDGREGGKPKLVRIGKRREGERREEGDWEEGIEKERRRMTRWIRSCLERREAFGLTEIF